MTEPAAKEIANTYAQDLQAKITQFTHRDFQLKAFETRSLQVSNGILILLYCDDQVLIDSELGIYDRLSEGVGEVQHVHANQITLQNYSDSLKNAEFYEVVFAQRP